MIKGYNVELLSVSFFGHARPPSGDKVYKGVAGLWFNPNYGIDIESSYDRESIRYGKKDGESYIFFERWVPCNCSDGPCELGLMDKFEVKVKVNETIQKEVQVEDTASAKEML